MAGSTKVAVLATLMFAMLLSGSIVDAARPIVSEGSVVAADGSVAGRRQLKTLFFLKCRLFWWHCGPRVVPIFVQGPVVKHPGPVVTQGPYVAPGNPTVAVGGNGDFRVRAEEGSTVTVQGRRLQTIGWWWWWPKFWGKGYFDHGHFWYGRRLQGDKGYGYSFWGKLLFWKWLW